LVGKCLRVSAERTSGQGVRTEVGVARDCSPPEEVRFGYHAQMPAAKPDSPSHAPAAPAMPPDAKAQLTRDAVSPAARPRAYRRVLLKLSGEALGGGGGAGTGLDPDELRALSREVREACRAGAQVAIVVGGGNFIRGATMARIGKIHQATADYMGMLATIINGLALKETLLAEGVDSRVMSAIEVKAVAEPFIRGRALRHMEKGRVLILVAGTGNPFCTTDTCAALRAAELDCQVILKATKVDGVYSADPARDPAATRYDTLTYMEALTKNLRVMDMTAFAMCQERRIPIIVFDFRTPGNIRRVIEGERLGTLISDPAPRPAVPTQPPPVIAAPGRP
jgi:uridylate kinase